MIDQLLQKKTNFSWLIAIILLIVLTILIYMPVMQHDFINFDDPFYVYGNYYVHKGFSVEGVKWAFFTFEMSNWHPVTWLSHMLDCQFFGLDPAKHHLVNLFFHILNSLLLFYIFLFTTKKIWHSLFIALFFSVHPMHIESVAWISERKDLLFTFFMFLSIGFYINWVKSEKKRQYWCSFIFFVLGLLSKPMIITLPMLLVIFDFWPLNRFELNNSYFDQKQLIRSFKLFVIEKIPFFLAALLSCFLTLSAQMMGGAVGSLTKYPLLVRFYNASTGYIKYIIKMLLPFNLSIFYPYQEKIIWPFFLFSIAIIVVLSIISIYLSKKTPFFISGWLWYILSLLPVIGIIQVGEQAFADRYTYIPYIGLFVIIIYGLYSFFERWSFGNIVTHAVLISFSFLLIFVSIKQVKVWANSISLYTHAINVTDDNYVANMNMGGALIDAKKYSEALIYFSEAARIKPDSVSAHNNIGITLMTLGQNDKAISSFLTAIEINPNSVVSYFNIANIYLNKGRHADSIKYFTKALDLNPKEGLYYNNMGVAYFNMKNLDNALYCFQKAYEFGYKDAKKNIAVVVSKKQNFNSGGKQKM